MAKGDVEYIIRADDSQLESDLDSANKKVESKVQDSADKTVDIEKKKTAEVKKETNKIVDNTAKATDKMEEDFRQVGKTAEKSLNSIDDDIDVNIEANADVSDAENKIKTISKDREIDIDVEADTSEAEESLEGLKEIGAELSEEISGNLKGAFDDALKSASPLAGTLAPLASKLGGTAGLAVGLGAAFVGAGALATKSASEMQSAMNDFAAETGMGKAELDRYQGVLENIYAHNYGEDFQDIADSMSMVTKNLGEMDDATLENLTESALALRDTFEYDVGESTRATKALMDNLGISGEEAMNLIAAGAQNGLDYSGELLDTVSEYSVQFGKLGFSADEMFNIFQKGADTGAWNLDKMGDAIKEFSIRAVDGSETTREGFQLIGLDADEMSAKFAQGGETAREAFDETIEGLAKIEDPLERNQAGVDLFGTMWEDLGEDAVLALANMEDGAYTAGNELEKLKEIKYEDLGSMLEGLSRALELVLVPLGEALMPLLMTLIEAILPVVTELLTPLIEIISGFIEPLLMLISAGIQPLIDILMLLFNMTLKPILTFLQEVFMPIFDAIFQTIAEVVDEKIGSVKAILEGLIEFIKAVFTGDWGAAWQAVIKIYENLPGPIRGVIDSVKTIFGGLIQFVTGIFSGNWSRAWNGIKSIFSGIWNGLSGVVTAPLNAVIGIINSFIGKVNKLKIPEWVPGIGGKGINIPKIPKLKVGMDYVPTDDFPALLHAGEMVLTKEEASKLRKFNSIDGMIASLTTGMKEFVRSSVNNTEKTTNVYQTVNFNQPQTSPAEASRIAREEIIKMGLVGDSDD